MHVLKLQIFAELRLKYNGKILSEKEIQSKRTRGLLLYILMNRVRVLKDCELFDVMDLQERKNLKSVIHKVRKILQRLGNDRFILTVKGGYRWNPDIQVETDYDQYEALIQLLPMKMNEVARKKLYADIVQTYNEISSLIKNETFILEKSITYQQSYYMALHALCNILQRNRQWKRLEEICTEAVRQNPYDGEIYCHLLKSLQKQEQYSLAILQFEKIKKLYSSRQILCPEKIKRIFQEIISEMNVESRESFLMITKDLQEIKKEEHIFCDYGIFLRICQMELCKESKPEKYVALLTATSKTTCDMQIVKYEEMGILEQVICKRIQVQDIVTRCSMTQIAMLLCREYGDCMDMMQQIQQEFYKKVDYVEIAWNMIELFRLEELMGTVNERIEDV